MARASRPIKEDWIRMNVTAELVRFLERRGDIEMLAISCTSCRGLNYTTVFGMEVSYREIRTFDGKTHASFQMKLDLQTFTSLSNTHIRIITDSLFCYTVPKICM